MRVILLAGLMALGLAVAGCGSSQPRPVAMPNLPQAMPVDPPGGSHMLTANTYAGDALHAMLLRRMGSGSGILTTSFVDMHNFERTSGFGRVVSQQVGSRLGQYGFRVIEARLASTLSMAPGQGEFMLTRETARLLSDTYDAGAVLVGSYSAEGSRVFVSARVVRLSDNVVMAAYEYFLPRDGDVSRLLAGSGGGADTGNGILDLYGSRTPAFAPCPAAGSARPSAQARSASAGGSGARSGVRGPDSVPVPRHVDPNAPEPARRATAKPTVKPAAKAPVPASVAPAPAAPVAAAPPVAKDTPAPVEPAVTPPPPPARKDAPAPAGVPGG